LGTIWGQCGFKNMANITKRSNGKWQAKIRRHGWPDQSKTFDTKTDGEAWARAVEREMDIGAFVHRDDAERTTFGDAAERYRREVLPSKRGAAQDGMRLNRLIEEFGKYSLASISAAMLSAYRDTRLKAVSPQTVVHELGMLSRVFKACAMDWGIALPQGIPTALVRKPKVDNDRDRVLVGNEERLLTDALRDCKTPWPLAAFVLAVETAGRQGELLSMKWKEVDLIRRTARLRGLGGGVTKSGAPYRDVPLSGAAVAMLTALPRALGGKVLPLTQNALQLSFERAKERGRRTHIHALLKEALLSNGYDAAAADGQIRALIYKKKMPTPLTVNLLASIEADDQTLLNLTFHDLRHVATTRLALLLQMHELMKCTGHKSSKMVMRYYHPDAEALALKLG
jgi:integrase